MTRGFFFCAIVSKPVACRMLYVVVDSQGKLLCVATCAVDAHLCAKKENATVYTCIPNATSVPQIMCDYTKATA